MTGTDGSITTLPAPVYGEAAATENLVLTTAPLATWLPVVGAEVTLTEPGTYRVTAQVQGQITQNGPATQGQVINLHARMFNATDGVPLGAGEFIPVAGFTHGSADLVLIGEYATQDAFITITGPTTIRLEGRIDQQGADTRGDPCRIFAFRSAVLYERIGP